MLIPRRPLDGVVAARPKLTHPPTQITVEQLDMAMKTNVYGLLTCAQCCTPAMVEKKTGNIIITGATASLRGMPFTSAFAAAKGGQKSLAQSMARQLWKDNVHVALCCGTTATPRPTSLRGTTPRPTDTDECLACHACGGSADCPATSYCRGNGVCQGFPDYSSFDPRGECCARP